jgi:hypothetical protein
MASLFLPQRDLKGASTIDTEVSPWRLRVGRHNESRQAYMNRTRNRLHKVTLETLPAFNGISLKNLRMYTHNASMHLGLQTSAVLMKGCPIFR